MAFFIHTWDAPCRRGVRDCSWRTNYCGTALRRLSSLDTRWAGRRVEADSLSCATARYFDPCSKRGPTFDWTMVPGSLQHLSVVSSDVSPHHSLGEHPRYLITYTIVAFRGSTNGIIGYLARPFRVTGHDGSSSSKCTASPITSFSASATGPSCSTNTRTVALYLLQLYDLQLSESTKRSITTKPLVSVYLTSNVRRRIIRNSSHS